MRRTSFHSLLLVFGLALIAIGCGDRKKLPPQAIVARPVAPPVAEAVETNPAVAQTESKPDEEMKPEVEEPKEQAASAPTDADQDPSNPKTAEKPNTSAARGNMPKLPITAKTPPKPRAEGRPDMLKPAITTTTPQSPRKEGRPFTEAAYLTKDLVGLFVVHPKQFSESPIGKMLTDLGVEEYTFRGNGFHNFQGKLAFADIERLTVVIDQAFIDQFNEEFGMPVAVAPVIMVDGPDDVLVPTVPATPVDAPADAAVTSATPVEPTEAVFIDKRQIRNSLKQIALAFHNYHDVNSGFPRADGDASGDTTGLSWRVHLLPYLDEAELFNQFHFDEAWDSEHNKTLISQMPAIFESPGVDDEGKTSIHVFTGENTLFHGDKGSKIQEITDGSSNTILAVIAGSDKAEVWTKPGGLEVDLDAPRKSLGEMKGKQFFAIIVDGSVRELPTAIAAVTLANMIQPADGNPVAFDFEMEKVAEPEPSAPVVILALANDAKLEDLTTGLLGESTSETHAGQSFQKNKTTAIWFPDRKTVVIGAIESVKQIISTKSSAKGDASPLIGQLQLGADFTFAIDVASQEAMVQIVASMSPLTGMIKNIKTVAGHISAAGSEGGSLFELIVTAIGPNLAMGLSALANLGLDQAKAAAMTIPQTPNLNANDEELQRIVKSLISSATVELDEDRIRFRVPVPEGFDRLPELLKPALESAREAAKGAQLKNNLKQMGLAFHNFESVFRTFPGSGRINANKPVGLSWRVYLLPFLDQAPLYNQFKFDEPWDSDHNKKLIEQMPAVYKSPAVDEIGKTSVHVFIGPGTPFADDKTPTMADFTDGTSNTFLAVQAGPDTAEIWTKPGGLDFDPEDPIKALGNLIGERFLALFADGSVKDIDKGTDAATLRRLIQHQDGEPIQ